MSQLRIEKTILSELDLRKVMEELYNPTSEQICRRAQMLEALDQSVNITRSSNGFRVDVILDDDQLPDESATRVLETMMDVKTDESYTSNLSTIANSTGTSLKKSQNNNYISSLSINNLSIAA